MMREPERAYDSFVVRLWRDPASGRLLRAEVEHVQTGTISAERGVPPEWILDCLRSCLEGRLGAGAGEPERDAATFGSPTPDRKPERTR